MGVHQGHGFYNLNVRFSFPPFFLFPFFRFICSLIFHSGKQDNLDKGIDLTKDQPDVDHLDIRGGGQALHLAHEDGGHHQHGGQVHTQGCLKEERLEENGGKGDCCQKKCGEICCHQLTHYLPFQNHYHLQ